MFLGGGLWSVVLSPRSVAQCLARRGDPESRGWMGEHHFSGSEVGFKEREWEPQRVVSV